MSDSIPSTVTGVLVKADELNANGRTYSADVLKDAVARFERPKPDYGTPRVFVEPIADDDWAGKLRIYRSRMKSTITTGRVAYYRNVNHDKPGQAAKTEAIRVHVTIAPPAFSYERHDVIADFAYCFSTHREEFPGDALSDWLLAEKILTPPCIELDALQCMVAHNRLMLVALWDEQLRIIEQAHAYDPFFAFCYYKRHMIPEMLIDSGDAT